MILQLALHRLLSAVVSKCSNPDISIVASNGVGSTYTYQWYSVLPPVSIPGATSISYTPPTSPPAIT